MKQILKLAFAALLAVSAVQCARDGEDGKDGIDGINGINGTNGSTIISGTGAPVTTLGNIGDFYLDRSTLNLYGPKSDNGWGSPISLKGKDGADGQNGQNGTNGTQILSGNTAPAGNIGNIGDWYINLQDKRLYGPKTAEGWGEGISLTGSLKGDYVLSADGTTLFRWLNKEITEIDMQADTELSKITTIATNAFRSGYLSKITLPKQLTKINKGAFAINNLNSIDLPNSVNFIGDLAFQGNSLTSVVIPNGVTSIRYGTFYQNQLSDIYIPSSVTSIEDHAFRSNQLSSVILPNGVTTIGQRAFAENPLTSVVIPNSVTTIGHEAFINYQAETLTSVIVNATIPPKIGSNIFNYIDTLKIYVPAESVEDYKNAEGWRDYAKYIIAK